MEPNLTDEEAVQLKPVHPELIEVPIVDGEGISVECGLVSIETVLS
jgi:hypothetical protein